jgi:hypothetical protein
LEEAMDLLQDRLLLDLIQNKEVMAKGRTENQRKFYMEYRKRLQLGFDTNVQKKQMSPNNLKLHLFIILGLYNDAFSP